PPIMTPAVLVDKAGVVLVWSLPEVLSSHFQVNAYCSTAWISTDLSGPHADNTWCMVHGNFEGADIQGCLNFSSAWFQQGRNVSCPNISPS
ncbi:hypothetical protein PAXRUDRAFT_162183, partial [Paxillus rubicundulus Ve08.2h10]